MTTTFNVTLILGASLVATLATAANTGTPSRSDRVDCQQSLAGSYACQRIDLLAHLSLAELDGGSAANDIWGWTDPDTGNEYVLIGTITGTVFVDITSPQVPLRLGILPGHDELRCAKSTRHDDAGGGQDGCAEGSAWRDVKVYKDHAYVVSEASGHGLQVFDLRSLRGVKSAQTFSETAWYNGFGSAHNIAINETSGFAYAVGTSTYNGGVHFVDIRVPASPVAAGGFSADGYTHDAQCITYAGPDADYTGAEVCLLLNEDTVTIVDVSNKSNPRMVSRNAYTRASYTHQGWLDDSHTWLYVNDEFDERTFGGRTRTYVWNLADLDAPRLSAEYQGLTETIDHNNYVRGRYLYQSNYTSGLRILDISTPAAPLEIAWFDSFPSDDFATYDGSWSNYPYFESGVLALSDIDGGLFLLAPTDITGMPAADLLLSVDNVSQPDSSRLQFRYDATVTNPGTDTVSDVIVTHILDDSVSGFTTSDANIVCKQHGRFVRCNLGDLVSGASATVALTLNATTGGLKLAEVQASALNPETDTTNNKATGSVTLLGSAPVTSTPVTNTPAGGGGGGGAFLWGSVVLLLARKLRHRRV